VNCDVVGFIALDEILGFFSGGVVSAAFEFHFGNDFLHNSAANSTCFRAPFDVIATFERLTSFNRYRTEDASRQAIVRRKALSTMPSTS
jgi:hypothetical protein